MGFSTTLYLQKPAKWIFLFSYINQNPVWDKFGINDVFQIIAFLIFYILFRIAIVMTTSLYYCAVGLYSIIALFVRLLRVFSLLVTERCLN